MIRGLALKRPQEFQGQDLDAPVLAAGHHGGHIDCNQRHGRPLFLRLGGVRGLGGDHAELSQDPDGHLGRQVVVAPPEGLDPLRLVLDDLKARGPVGLALRKQRAQLLDLDHPGVPVRLAFRKLLPDRLDLRKAGIAVRLALLQLGDEARDLLIPRMDNSVKRFQFFLQTRQIPFSLRRDGGHLRQRICARGPLGKAVVTVGEEAQGDQVFGVQKFKRPLEILREKARRTLADEIPVEKMKEWEAGLLQHMRTLHPEIGQAIVTQKVLTDTIKEQLDAAIQEYNRTASF